MPSNVENKGERLFQTKEQLVVIVMGSRGDSEYAGGIVKTLEKFGVPYQVRVGSAHKSGEHLLSMLREYNDQEEKDIIFIAVAGRSNALGGFIDANTDRPVISAPPYSDKYGGADIFSSLRMPSGIGTMVAGEPEIAALAAIKILALNDPILANKVLAYQREMREKIISDDRETRELGLK